MIKKSSVSNISNFGGVVLLRDQVYQAIKGEIILGRLKPGETININEIAKNMNISTAPVREALNMLDKDGLIELHPHKKAAVAKASKRDFQIVVELRKRLEPFAARISMDLIPEDHLDLMLERLHDALENSDDLMKYISTDIELHEILYSYYGSKMLTDIMSLVRNLQCCYGIERTDEPEDVKKDLRETYIKEHIEIVKALKAKNGDLVEKLILEHLENYEDLGEKYIPEDE